MNKKGLFDKFKRELEEMTHLGAAIAILHWDQEVFMPQKGANARAKTIAYLAGVLHEKFVSKNFEDLILKIKRLDDGKKLNAEENCIFREVWREFQRGKKLPANFVRELVETCSKAQQAWVEARKKSNFKMFLPYLKKIVELKRKEASLVGFKKNPYDALLDVYAPGMTTEEMGVIFDDLKSFLVPFLKNIKKSKVKTDPNFLKGNFPIQKQAEFNKFVAQKIGFDFEAGRLDSSAHPFTTNFNAEDARITTRYKEDDLLDSITSTIHEAGHGMYEQGILTKNFGTPLGESISIGVHESQSKIWENLVGRGKPFWRYLFPIMQKEFPKPFSKIKFNDFYKSINCVKPSLIRVESDEVTYNLHIIMRFEIEKELIDGSIKVEDLPKIWNAKTKEYFGIKVPNDAFGVLQDVHWAHGSFGYFPAYTLGNLYSAQFYNAAKNSLENLEKNFSKGKFSQFREWLRANIHIHGKMYSAEELLKRITGENLNSHYFIDYIKNKYSEIYNI